MPITELRRAKLIVPEQLVADATRAGATGEQPSISDVVARPIWVDRDAAPIMRDVMRALADDLVARVHHRHETSRQPAEKVEGEWLSEGYRCVW